MSGNKIAQDKLKLLYILKHISTPLTNSELTNFILENDVFDYFTLQYLLGDLCDSGFVVPNFQNGHKYYSITPAGSNALEMFGEKLPEYFINQVEQNFSSLKMEIRKHRELIGHYYKRKEDEYIVSLQVMENGSVIFSLSINVPDEGIAKHICEKWNISPEEIFSSIIKTLTS